MEQTLIHMQILFLLLLLLLLLPLSPKIKLSKNVGALGLCKV